MKYLIFILLILSLIGTYFYYTRKLELLKKQLILTTTKYSSVKNKYNNNIRNLNNISIKFVIPSYKGATLKNNSNLYISPLITSHILNSFNSNIEIAILDCAEVNNETWFYVNTPSTNNINCRGWINSNDISIFYSNSSSINRVTNS